jgi:hypothetical protein
MTEPFQPLTNVLVIVHDQCDQFGYFTLLAVVFLCGTICPSQILFSLLVAVLSLEFVQLEICDNDVFSDLFPDVLLVVEIFKHKVLCKVDGLD